MDTQYIEQLLKQILAKETTINFVAKWTTETVEAVQIGGVWTYQIPKRFIAVNEVTYDTGSYGADHLLPATVARKHALYSSSVNLLQAYNGINLDLSDGIQPAGNFTKRFFRTEDEIAAGALTTTNVKEGDAVMIITTIQ